MKEKRVIAILGIDGSGKSSTSRMVSEELSLYTPVGFSSDRLYLYEKNIIKEVYNSLIERIRHFCHRIAKRCKKLEIYKVPKIAELVLRNYIIRKLLKKNSNKIFVLDGSPLLNMVAWNCIFKKNFDRNAHSAAIKLLSGNGEKMIIEENVRKCLLSEFFWIKRFKANRLLIPDIVVLLDIQPETALERINMRNENKQTHETRCHLLSLRQGYHLVCSILKTEWKIPVFIVDASIEQRSVVDNILGSINRIMNLKRSFKKV